MLCRRHFFPTWWWSNEWPKHAVGSNKVNIQKFRCCDCMDWTIIDWLTRQDVAQKQQTSEWINAPHLNVNLPHKHTLATSPPPNQLQHYFIAKTQSNNSEHELYLITAMQCTSNSNMWKIGWYFMYVWKQWRVKIWNYATWKTFISECNQKNHIKQIQSCLRNYTVIIFKLKYF